MSRGCLCVYYLLGLQRGFDHQPALCALCVLHLYYVMTQIFSSHGHQTVLTLKKDSSRRK